MPGKKQPTQMPERLIGLELIRFVSAMAVVLFHYSQFWCVGSVKTGFDPQQQPFYSWLWFFYDHGNYGVQIFFCISGFIFFYKYASAITAHQVSSKTFFILRFSRLYPLHLATLILVAILQLAYVEKRQVFFVYPDNDPIHFLKHAFMVSNWSSELVASFNGPSWSISIETAVYLVFYIVLSRVGRSYWVNAAMLCFFVAAKAAGISHSIVDGLGYFYAGGLAAMFTQAKLSLSQRQLLDKSAWVLLMLIPVLVWIFQLQARARFGNLFLIAYTPLVLYCAAGFSLMSEGVKQSLEVAGNMTYSSYLMHFPLQLAIAFIYAAVGTAIPYQEPVFFMMYLGSVLVTSYVIYRYFEMPAQNAIRKALFSPKNMFNWR